jgi:hypothetical protein
VTRASIKHERAQKRAAKKGATLKPMTETLADAPAQEGTAEIGEGAPAPDSYLPSAELEQD